MKKTGLTLFLIVFTLGCAHHRDVRPGVDGVHHVVVRAEDKESAEQSAISQAEHYCEQTKRSMAIINEKTEYTGTMDEATRNTLRKASKAATVLGGTRVSHRKGTEAQDDLDQSNILHDAGKVGNIMTSGDDYRTEMTFKCQ